MPSVIDARASSPAPPAAGCAAHVDDASDADAGRADTSVVIGEGCAQLLTGTLPAPIMKAMRTRSTQRWGIVAIVYPLSPSYDARGITARQEMREIARRGRQQP